MYEAVNGRWKYEDFNQCCLKMLSSRERERDFFKVCSAYIQVAGGSDNGLIAALHYTIDYGMTGPNRLFFSLFR